MYEQMIHNTEELNAMAVHLRMSQNFSELKALAAQWLVPEQDVQDFINGKRYQLAEIPLAEKEYTSAVEKLREEMWLLKDQNFTDIVARHLIKKAEKDALFSCKVLKKHKSLQKCMNYIMEQAYKIAEKEYEKRFGKNPNTGRRTNHQSATNPQSQTVSMGMAEIQVYQWAEEYYALNDEAKEKKEKVAETKKRLKSLEKEEKRKKNMEASKKAASVNSVKTPAEKAEEPSKEEQKEPAVLEKEKKDGGKKKQNMESGQLSLFDLGTGIEAEKVTEGGKQ